MNMLEYSNATKSDPLLLKVFTKKCYRWPVAFLCCRCSVPSKALSLLSISISIYITPFFCSPNHSGYGYIWLMVKFCRETIVSIYQKVINYWIVFIECTLVDLAFLYTTDLHVMKSMNIPIIFSRLTSTHVTWAGWQVSSLEGIIMWSKWNWKVQRTHWGCVRWRSSVGKRVRASRFWDRSQPAWPSRRTARPRLSECFASSPHRSV